MATVLADYFDLGEQEKNFHPVAVENYRQFMADIRKGVPLDKLTDEDMKSLLGDWDFHLYQDAVKSLREWLNNCVMSNPESSPGELPFWGTYWLKPLLLKASRAKHGMELLVTERREREAKAIRAQSECNQYIMGIRLAITKFKHDLAPQKKPKFAYPAELAAHHPDSWCELGTPAEQDIAGWARPKIEAMVPPILRGLVGWDFTTEVLHLPRCKYAHSGLPCVEWRFKRTLLVRVHLAVTPADFTRTFRGRAFRLSLPPEDLGCLYLEPVWWDDEEGFATPVALLRLLAAAELESPGITILSHDGVTTVYTIEGYDEDSVEVRTGFVKFIKAVSKNQPLPQALLFLGMVDDGTAKLLEAKWNMPLPTSAIPPVAPGEAEVVDKLMEVGWSEDDAKKAVAGNAFPAGASTEDVVKTILAKGH